MVNPSSARWAAFLLAVALTGCSPVTSAAPESEPSSRQIILRNWEGDISREILDAFEEETGIHVVAMPYDSQEEVIAQIIAGDSYDVFVVENQLIPDMVAQDLLAPLDFQNIPNFKNISANFRDLAYDPGNVYSIPYSWGTTGLLVRTDLVPEPITSWSDLWDPSYAGKVMMWPLYRYALGASLQSLGYSVNSEEPAELEAAFDHLLVVRDSWIFKDWEMNWAIDELAHGEAWIVMGEAGDAVTATAENEHIAYIIPSEGGFLWGDNFTIPANTLHKPEAEEFINFMLEAEIAAQDMNETHYWLPNDAALEFVDRDLRENPIIFPPDDIVRNAETILPLSPDGVAFYESLWADFVTREGR